MKKKILVFFHADHCGGLLPSHTHFSSSSMMKLENTSYDRIQEVITYIFLQYFIALRN